MDHGSKIEIMHLETPEQLGGERMHRVYAGVDLLSSAVDIVIAEAERAMAGASVAAEAERIHRNADTLKVAENVVRAEEQRIVDARADRENVAEINDAVSAVAAAFEGNPLIQG